MSHTLNCFYFMLKVCTRVCDVVCLFSTVTALMARHNGRKALIWLTLNLNTTYYFLYIIF